MATYKTKGIILKRHHYNEADRILTVLTRKKGKIRAIAKGVRKPLSKLGCHLEPFYEVDFMLAEGRGMDTVTGAVVEKYFRNLHSDLMGMGRACKLGELINQLTDEHQEQTELFDLLSDCLGYLNDNSERQEVDSYFQVNALSLLGYRPELFSCVNCRQEVLPDVIYWSSQHGGVVCDNCHSGVEKWQVSADVVKALRLFTKHDITILSRLKLSDELRKEMERAVGEFVVYLNQKELVSDRFLQSIRGANVELARN